MSSNLDIKSALDLWRISESEEVISSCIFLGCPINSLAFQCGLEMMGLLIRLRCLRDESWVSLCNNGTGNKKRNSSPLIQKRDT